jgi:polyketide synthase PksJ
MTDPQESPTETEKKVVEIWTEILHLRHVGLDDDFLSLGGDSLSGMLCISRVHQTFGVEVYIEDFFLEDATVRKLSMLIDLALSEVRKRDK